MELEDLTNFKTYYKVTVTKIVWYWWKDKRNDHWNKVESRNRPICGGSSGKEVFSTNGAESTESLCGKKWKSTLPHPIGKN